MRNEAPARLKRLLTIRETADYMGISPKTVRNRLLPSAKDPFPVKPKRIGKKPVFDIRELDRYIDGLTGTLT